MRFVVFGAGAIGGLVGARLFQHGEDVTLIARGDHARALASGLVLEAPDESVTLPIPVVTTPAGVAWTDDTVVLLGVKGQDTEEALGQLLPVAPPGTPIVCMQNGVENERRALRRFPRTYAMCVMCPATHLRPGVIVAHSAPVSGLLDLGCFESGVDDDGAGHRRHARCHHLRSVARPDIMRWKYRKLLMNLANAVEALSGPDGRRSDVARAAQREGDDVLAAAGIAVATPEEDRARRGDLLQMRTTVWMPGVAARAGRASPAGPGRSRPSTSTGRSCCSARSTACPPRSTACCSGWRSGRRPTVVPRARGVWRSCAGRAACLRPNNAATA